MSQQLDNAPSPEEVQIRRMLAYKSLILSILQRSIVILIIAAILVSAIVMFFFRRQQQKVFFRFQCSKSLSYYPAANTPLAKNLNISDVLQIVKAAEIKKKAGEQANIPADKENMLYSGLSVSYNKDRNTKNQLILSVRWDDKSVAETLCKAYVNAAKKAYEDDRKQKLESNKRGLQKQIVQKSNERKDIDDELQKLTKDSTSLSLAQEQEYLASNAHRLEDEIAECRKQMLKSSLTVDTLEKTVADMQNNNKKEINQKTKIIDNYSRIMTLINDRDSAIANLEILKKDYKGTHPKVINAQEALNQKDKKLKKELGFLKITEEQFVNFDSTIVGEHRELQQAKNNLAKLKQHIQANETQLQTTKDSIKKLNELRRREEELKQQHSNLSNEINALHKDIVTYDELIQMTLDELKDYGRDINATSISGLSSKQYIVSLFAGGVFAGILAVLIIFVSAQFGCISSANELHDMAEIEVFSLSESQLKKLDDISLQEAAHNVFYVLNQVIEERRYLFYGALRGSYSTTLLFEQLLLQFAMNGTRLFILNLEPYDLENSEGDETNNETGEDPISDALLGVEKNGDKGVFRLGNASFISPNESEILKMDIETLLKHYDKIIFKRNAPFVGNELLLKQVITLTQCCLFSVGKNRSPRSFLRFLRESHSTEETVITGIFTEP